MIDEGAEEIEEDDNEVIITSSFEDFGSINHKFEELGIEPKSAELQRLPNTTKSLPLEQAQTILKMLEKFEDDDDVQQVFHNMEITEELQNSIN